MSGPRGVPPTPRVSCSPGAIPAPTPVAGEPSVFLDPSPTPLASHCPHSSAPTPGMHCLHQPACRMGPLSVLPPKPNLSQKGGAQWASQWQFFLLLHTFQGRGEKDTEREAGLGLTVHLGRQGASEPPSKSPPASLASKEMDSQDRLCAE